MNQEGKRTGYKFYNKEGEMTFDENYTYNEMGFLSKQHSIDSEGEESVFEYEYEYGELNNWVKVTGYSDEYNMVTEREITYFPE